MRGTWWVLAAVVSGCTSESAIDNVSNGATVAQAKTHWVFSQCFENGGVMVGKIAIADDGTARALDRNFANPQELGWVAQGSSTLLFTLKSGQGPLYTAGFRSIDGSIDRGSFDTTIVNADGSIIFCEFSLLAGAI